MTSTALYSNTAQQTSTQKSPVYEYSCLFTHDIRRKNTKRWQDGFLRFHLFNCRVMVYDQSRNYIGDTHYRDAGPAGLDDGDELKLERGGVLVQVGEKLSVQETDLSDLLAKRPPKPAPQDPPPNRRDAPGSNVQPRAQLQPKPANITPYTPGKSAGWATRAQIPKHSPFDVRQSESTAALQGQSEQGRPAKRQRREEDNEHVPLWQILKTAKPPRENASIATTIPAPTTAPVSKQPSRSRVTRQLPESQILPHSNSIVDLISSPASPVKSSSGSPLQSSAVQDRHDRRDLSDKRHFSKCERRTVVTSPCATKNIPTSIGRPLRPSSPPVSTTSHIPAANEDMMEESAKQGAAPAVESSNSPRRKTKPLRLATTAPRKMLFCQTMGSMTGPKDSSRSTSAHKVQNKHRPLREKDLNADDISHDESKSSPLQDRSPKPKQKDNLKSKTNGKHQVDNDAEESVESAKGHSVPEGETVQNLDDANIRKAPSSERYGSNPLDAQFLLSSKGLTAPKPSTMSETLPPETMNAIIDSTTPARPSQRPFHRHYSDTSPSKSVPAKPPLKRADTLGAPQEHEIRAAEAPRAIEQLVSRPQSRRPSLQSTETESDTDRGPWSREAWDLFGWCPEGRAETLGWNYATTV